MKIPYRLPSEYQPVEVSKLRPGGSYKQLIEKRTHPIDKLVRVHGRIPPDLLTARPCPTCGHDDPRGASVKALDEASVGKITQVATDRILRDSELLRQRGGKNTARSVHLFQNDGLPLLGRKARKLRSLLTHHCTAWS